MSGVRGGGCKARVAPRGRQHLLGEWRVVISVDEEMRHAGMLRVLLEQAMAGTDCGTCDWPTCKEYAEALAFGKDENPHKCEPGGVDSKFEADMILRSWKAGKVVPEALGQGEQPAAAATPEPAKA